MSLRKTLSKLLGDGSALFVLPRRSILNEELAEMETISGALGFSISFASVQNLLAPARGRSIRLTTPAHLLAAMTRHKPSAPISGISLVVCDSLEQLDALYELGVSLLRHATQTQPTRFVGLTASLNDPADLAAWLDVAPHALHSFRPADRDTSLSVSARPFALPQSAALFKAMARPAHLAIAAAPEADAQAIVFVPSRAQCRPVALDLITHRTLATQTAGAFLPADIAADDLAPALARLRDPSLADFVLKGVGFFHDGLAPADRALMLELFGARTLRVLLVPRDAAWALRARACVVVMLGTQYVHFAPGSDAPRVRDYALADVARMQGRAVRANASSAFHVFCQAEDKDTVLRFLEDGLPLESQLAESAELRAWYAHRRRASAIDGAQDGVQALGFTFLARRVARNPAYYDASGSRDEFLSRLADELEEAFAAGENQSAAAADGAPSATQVGW
jgi:antiviral helicase SLH1